MSGVPRTDNGSFYTCEVCRRPIEDDFYERPSSTPGLNLTSHGRCVGAESTLVSVEKVDNGEEVKIHLTNGVYRCSYCDAHTEDVGEPLPEGGAGATDTDWQRHVDTAHRSRKTWKYGNWYQTFS